MQPPHVESDQSSREESRGMVEMLRSHPRYIICVLLALAVIGIYAQTAGYGYVGYDDDLYVYHNAVVSRGLTAHNVVWAFTTFLCANWHPLTWISYMLDFNLFGASPGAKHLVNLAFHLASSILLFLFFSRATGNIGRSAFVAAIFALHPLRVESVAWISERKDVLCVFFEILALFLYVRYTEKPGTRTYLAVAAAFTLSLLSKPMAVTFPLLLLLVDFWPLGRIGMPVSAAALRRLLVEKIPLLALSAAACVVTVVAQRSGGAVVTLHSIRFSIRAANAVIGYARYIGKFLWPSDLALLYPLQSPDVRLLLLSIAILGGLMAVAWRNIHRRPYIIVGLLWFFGTLVPAIGLVQVGVQSIADRYTYLPGIGLAIALVWTIGDWIADRRGPRLAVVAGGAACLAALAVVAFQQTTYWSDSRSLFEHTLSVTENNPIIENDLGIVEADEDNSQEASTLFRAAIEHWPEYAEAHANLGQQLLKLGQLDGAESEFVQAIELKPNFPQALSDLGVLMAARGNYQDARRYLTQSLSMVPEDAKTQSNLCYVLTALGRPGEAIVHCNIALELQPQLTNAMLHLQEARAAQAAREASGQ